MTAFIQQLIAGLLRLSLGDAFDILVRLGVDIRTITLGDLERDLAGLVNPSAMNRTPLTLGTEATVELLLVKDGFVCGNPPLIQAIREVRAMSGIGLREAKDIVDQVNTTGEPGVVARGSLVTLLARLNEQKLARMSGLVQVPTYAIRFTPADDLPF